MARKQRQERAVQASTRSTRPRTDPTDGATAPVGYSGPPAAAHRSVQKAAGDFVAELLQRDDGWLRLIPSRDGSPCYAKWKFTHGRHQNHYVMSVAQYWQVEYLFQMLLLKLDKVDAGDLSDLAKDTLYNHAADEKRNA